MLTDEQKYRLELAKDRTPSTSAFVWVIPAMLAFAFLTKAEPDAVRTVLPDLAREAPRSAPRHVDLGCGGATICVLGWQLM